jgi:methionine-rich copper-binding protein CopC/putative copper export protein
VLAAVAVLVALTVAQPAGAHPYLVAATPQGGVVAPTAPKQIQLAFTEALVSKGCSITVKGEDGRVIHLGKIGGALGGHAISAPLPKLAEGIYTVDWVAYGNDGHTVEGAFQFGVPSASGQPPPGAARLLATTVASAESAPTESLVPVAGRWLAALAAFAMLGAAVLFGRLRGRVDEELRTAAGRRWTSLAPAALGLALVGTLLEAWGRAQGPGGLDLALIAASTSGVAIIVRLGTLVVGGVVARVIARRAGSERGTALFGATGAVALATLAIDGHVSTVRDMPALAAIGQTLHLLSGGVWMGAAIVLALCLVPAARGPSHSGAVLTAVRAYAPIAIVAAAVTIVTGLIAAVREVSRWYFLRWSSYGHMLIIKIVVVGAVLVLGGATMLLARRALAKSASSPADWRRAGWFLRAEAAVGVVAIAIAALLAGTLQGRGQPLPSQRGNRLPGAGFANVALQNATGELVLAPSQLGLNRVVVTNAQSDQSGSVPPPPPKSVSVAFACGCRQGGLSFRVALHPGSAGPSGAWSADVALPRVGTYSAELIENGKPTVGSPTFTVGDLSSPGSTPVTVAAVADLSGPDATDCRSQELGALISIELMNASGGLGGNKIHQVLLDDRGNAALARTEALRLAAQHPVAFLAPCGQGAEAAIRAVGNSIPTIVADDNVPVTPGRRVFRLAPNPYAEGYAAGQYVAKVGLPSTPRASHRVAALIAHNADSERRLAGLEAALAPAHLTVDRFPAGGAGLQSRLRSLLPASSWLGIYADGGFSQLTAAMRVVGAKTARTVNPTPIVVSQRLASERFVIDSGNLGVEGQVRAITDVDPTSTDAPLYAELVPQVVGELATVPGLSGFVAGQALAYGLIGGDSASAISKRLREPGVFSKIATSPWSDRNPAAGTLIFRMVLAQFLPGNLIPAGGGAPSEPYAGQFFVNGAWEPASPELFSPLPINLTGSKTGGSG